MHPYKCIHTYYPEGYSNEINALGGGIHNKYLRMMLGLLNWVGSY